MKTFEYTAVVWKERKDFVSKCPELGVGQIVEIHLKRLEKAGAVKDNSRFKIENSKIACPTIWGDIISGR